MDTDALSTAIYTLEFSNTRKKYYFYNHVTKGAYWEIPDDLILIDSADVADILLVYNLLKNDGNLSEQREFINVLRRHSLKLPAGFTGLTPPEYTNSNSRLQLREWIVKKKDVIKQRNGDQLQQTDASQPSNSLFRQPKKMQSAGSLNLSQDSPHGSTENIKENNASRSSKESSPRRRRSLSSSSSSQDTDTDWRRAANTRGSDDKDPVNIVSHKPRGLCNTTGRGVEVRPGSGPPYRIYMGGIPYTTTQDDIRKFFIGIQLTRITVNHGNGEVEVRSAEDAVKAMKRDKEFIKGRYVNLRMMENTPKPGSSLNKGDGVGNQEQQSGERANKRSSSFSNSNLDMNLTKRPRIESVASNNLSNNMSRATMRIGSTPGMKSQPTPVNHVSKGVDIKSRLGKKTLTSTVTSGALEEMDWDRPQNELQTNDTIVAMSKLKNPSKYEKVYLVCDTCALINEPDFAIKLITRGCWLGVPVRIVIPMKVVDELDGLKSKGDGDDPTASKARILIRSLCQFKQSKQIDVQEGHLMWESVNTLKLVTNDDLILNCALQKKAECLENEKLVLITADLNFTIKAGAFNILTKDWNGLRKWLREFKYTTNESKDGNKVVSEEYKMDVDYYSDEEDELMGEVNTESSSVKQRLNGSLETPLETRNGSSPENQQKAIKLQNLIHTFVKEMCLEFKELLSWVLKKALDKEYKDLKQHATTELPSWTLIDYVKETEKRWFIISNKFNISSRLRSTFSEIIKFFKRSKAETSDWVAEDVDRITVLFTTVTEEIPLTQDYKQLVDYFMDRLNAQKKEWKEEWERLESEESLIEAISPGDIRSSEVDTALQIVTTYSCRNVDMYQSLQAKGVPMKNESEFRRLRQFIGCLDVLHSSIYGLVEMEDAKEDNKKVSEFIDALKGFKNEQGEDYNFDIGPESVLEVFCRPGFRKYICGINKTVWDLIKQTLPITVTARSCFEKYRQKDELDRKLLGC